MAMIGLLFGCSEDSEREEKGILEEYKSMLEHKIVDSDELFVPQELYGDFKKGTDILLPLTLLLTEEGLFLYPDDKKFPSGNVSEKVFEEILAELVESYNSDFKEIWLPVSIEKYSKKDDLIRLILIADRNFCRVIDSNISKPEPEVEKIFRDVSEFPEIKDTSEFILNLRTAIEFEVHESPYPKKNEKISEYKKVKIYGSEKKYVFIEYDYGNGCSAAYPWKSQFLLSEDGKLLKETWGKRTDFITIFSNQNPFFLVLGSTAKGNGGHQIYKFSNDTLENVLGNILHYSQRTYDAHEDESVNRPNELNISFADENRDGFNDIVFSGDKLMLWAKTTQGDYYDEGFSPENPAKVIPVKYVFLYNQRTGRFEVEGNKVIDN
ncbi:MAG: hypothetical protein ACJAWV_003149 [Flammeovirgaceae bacterium]|jgi:hypothetical protein